MPFLRDYTVSNPNFADDVVNFMGLQCTVDQVRLDIDRAHQNNALTPDQIASGELTLKERLKALIDRVEFIGHLDLVAQTVAASGDVLMGQEVTGIRWDIKSLRLYLALTCIDILCEKPEHRRHFEAVFSGAPDAIRSRLENGLLLRKPDGATGSLEEIGLFFYNVRNYYTHSGKRFHIKEDIPLDQLTTFKSGTMRRKEDHQLVVAEGVKLVDLIQSLALHEAKRRFGWATD